MNAQMMLAAELAHFVDAVERSVELLGGEHDGDRPGEREQQAHENQPQTVGTGRPLRRQPLGRPGVAL